MNNLKFKHANLLIVDDKYNIDIIINKIKQEIYSKVSEDDYISICSLIDINNYNDIKYIKPDGKYIKKEQISELISEFKNTSIYNLTRYYIIEYAENLNKSAANSILKFLEDPSDNIVAILITKNISNVLETIISRCNIININNYESKKYEDSEINIAVDFIINYEKYDKKLVAYYQEIYDFSTEYLIQIFNIMIQLYGDIEKNKYTDNKKNDFANNEQLIKLIQENKIDHIPEKIKKIDDCINLLNNNVNARIVLDKFILNI